MRVQHIKHALNPGKRFIFTDFVQCSYFELQQGNGVTARLNENLFIYQLKEEHAKFPTTIPKFA